MHGLQHRPYGGLVKSIAALLDGLERDNLLENTHTVDAAGRERGGALKTPGSDTLECRLADGAVLEGSAHLRPTREISQKPRWLAPLPQARGRERGMPKRCGPSARICTSRRKALVSCVWRGDERDRCDFAARRSLVPPSQEPSLRSRRHDRLPSGPGAVSGTLETSNAMSPTHCNPESSDSEADCEPLDILFLGTGTSHGIPMIGCGCAVCRSTDPRDKRGRASALLSWGGRNVVIDTGAEFRQQVLANGVTRLDAAFYTHSHADHIHGIDDVRGFNSRSAEPIPVFANVATAGFFRRTFSYIFAADPSTPNLPRMDLRVVGGAFRLFGRTIVPVPIYHAEDVILGYRVGGLAYLTDCSGLPEGSWPMLEGLDTLVVGALRPTPHPKHFSVDQALAFIEQVAPRRAYLSHISHKLSHRELESRLPEGVRPAYDGLRVRVRQERRSGPASLRASS